MAIDQPDDPDSPDPIAPSASRAHAKFGLGVGLSFLAGILLVAAFVLVWFGVFPGLVVLVVAIPLAVAGLKLIRKGEPATTTQR